MYFVSFLGDLTKCREIGEFEVKKIPRLSCGLSVTCFSSDIIGLLRDARDLDGFVGIL